MKKSMFLFVAACLFLSTTSIALAQEQAPSGPPKVLQIYREEVKPGKGAAHEKVEAGWPRAFANVKSPTHYLAMVSVTGPSEAWFVTGFDSLAAWEKDRLATEKNPALTAELDQLGAKDGELLSSVRSIVASYREELSYRATGVNLGQMRYFYVTTFRIRPGHENDFVEANKIIRAAHEKANVPEHWAVFQVLSGLPSGTYLTFQPLQSLAEVDTFPQTHGKTYQEATGDEGRQKLRELTSAGMLSSETSIFLFSPKMSYVSKETAAADPGFWTPKPAVQVAAVAKKEGKEAAAGKKEIKEAAAAKKEVKKTVAKP
ncbi:MAG: hypothetical protein HY237_04235 [Acidobacteria bacterium]|nr:hypothetical protein [Acidobacteriota bacterium]